MIKKKVTTRVTTSEKRRPPRDQSWQPSYLTTTYMIDQQLLENLQITWHHTLCT